MGSQKEPPFFNEDNVGPRRCKLTFYETMELFIETLTGTYFELRVSPFETVISVKIKIQRLEGIPVSQQHLIWNNIELEDDYCLTDYGISEGCTLKLVLAMRGGPINTRKVFMEKPLIEETEFMDPCSGDIWEKVTLLVYREGEQLNFFRIVDREDGTLSPLTESLSGGSIYNLHVAANEDTEASPSGQRIIENSITMNKMKLLKAKMENMNLSKKPQKILRGNPHPPMVTCPSSSSGVASHHKSLRALPHIGQSYLSSGTSYTEISPNALSTLATSDRRMPSSTLDLITEYDRWENVPRPPSISSSSSSRLPPKLSCVEKEDAKLSEHMVPPVPIAFKNSEKLLESNVATNRVLCPSITDVNQYAADSLALLTNANFAEPGSELYGTELQVSEGGEDSGTAEQPKESVTKLLTSATTDTSLFKFHELSPRKNTHLSPLHCSTQMACCSPLKPHTPSKYADVGNLRSSAPPNVPLSDANSLTDSSNPRTLRFRGISIDPPCKKTDTLSKKETRGTTDTPIKAPKDPVVSLNNVGLLGSLTQNTNRDGLQSSYTTSRFRTAHALSTNLQYFPEEKFGMSSPHNDMPGYVLPSGLGLGGNFVAAGKRIGNTTHLPPMNVSLPPKKKTAKHCFLCGKKTGLATSYECRCGNNFCAAHRYAETHTCTYDYKNAGRRYLQESNPVVNAPKLPKI